MHSSKLADPESRVRSKKARKQSGRGILSRFSWVAAETEKREGRSVKIRQAGHPQQVLVPAEGLDDILEVGKCAILGAAGQCEKRVQKEALIDVGKLAP